MNTLIKPTYLFVLAILVCACSASPEEYGRNMAQKECQCDLLKLDLDTKRFQQTLDDLKAKKFKSQMEMYKRPYTEKFAADSAALASCKAEQKSMEKEATQTFVKGEDRTTFTNAYKAEMEIREEEMMEKRNSYSAIERETFKLIRDLPPQ